MTKVSMRLLWVPLLVAMGLYDGRFAQATVYQSYPGARCVGKLSDIPYYSNSKSENETASKIWLYCAVDYHDALYFWDDVHAKSAIRDGDGLTWTAVVNNQHSGDQISCTLSMCDETYSVCNTSTDQTTSTGTTTLTGETNNYGSTDIATMRCELPAKYGGNRSAVISYETH
jgi:hypothetical protein